MADASAVADATTSAVSASQEASQALPFPPFDVSNFASQLLWFAIVFVVLYLVMSRLAVPQIGSIIDKRRGRIDGDLKEAERLKGDTDKAIAAYEEALATARRKATGIAEETRTAIKADLDNKRKDVEAELSRKVSEAEGRIQATKNEALGRVGEIATDTAAAVVSRLIGDANPKDVADAVAQVVKG